VPPGALDRATKFLDSVEHKQTGGKPASVYWLSTQTEQPEQAPTLTAMALAARHLLGSKKEDLQPSADWFIAKAGLPAWDGKGEKVDTLCWYFGSLTAFQQGGDTWKKWNEPLKQALTANQSKTGDDAGSWNPVGPLGGELGRAGQTALFSLCLEVYYRYLQLQP
jgi:hypothetical protein